MTTPERLRRRQRIESILVAILCVLLVAAYLASAARDDAQRECLERYATSQSETSKARSLIVERESATTRQIIRDAFKAKTPKEALRAYATYTKRLHRIDKARERVPVEIFDPADCS